MATENNEQNVKVNFSQGIFDWGEENMEIGDFLKELDKRKELFDYNPDQFLEISNGSETNFDVILATLTPLEKEVYKDTISKNSVPYIKVGTRYYLPNDKITSDLQTILGSDLYQKQSDFSAYWNDRKKELESDDKYVQWDKTKAGLGDFDTSSSLFPKKEGSDISIAQMKSLNIRVWLYSNCYKKLYDISPWVINCTTNKDFNMGSFTLELSPTDSLQISTYGGEFSNFCSLLKKNGSFNQDWFTKFVQCNDVIFIRYELLQLEKNGFKAELSDNNTHEVDFSKLKDTSDNRVVWDMIGLVDNVNIRVDSTNTEYSVQINGRDFSKLLVEDGSYFIPLKFVEGSPDRWFYGGDPESDWFKRNMVTGAYDYFFSYEFIRIDAYAGFIINQLSNIGIVDDEVFAGCARQTEKFPIETSDSGYQKGNKVKGVWQMIKLFFDESLMERRIVDRSLANPEGTLLDLFHKICQEPFVEFWGDTWGDGYDIIIRQPPFTKYAIQGIVDRGEYITISSEDVLNISLNYDNRAYSLYRLMPQNSLMGSSQFSSLAFVPIIFLNEFVEKFGNKRCVTNDMYLSYINFNGKENSVELNTMSQALLNDLLFVVETNSYLPFTRKGTITINGDRRIKVGTFIVLEPTGELFYVKAVNNTISFNDIVDRTTTLTVERGMFVKYIKDSTNNYFNIVDVKGIREDISKRDSKVKEENVQQSSTKFGVNKDVFEFFYRRNMFKEENND